MSWTDNFPELTRPQATPDPKQPAPVTVHSLRGIPKGASFTDVFRVTGHVVRVDQQATKAGAPCYFVNLTDAEGLKFSVVLWDWQWEQVQDSITEGKKATLDVMVPQGKYRSFRLAFPKIGKR